MVSILEDVIMARKRQVFEQNYYGEIKDVNEMGNEVIILHWVMK